MLTSAYFLIQYTVLFIIAMALFLHISGFYHKVSKSDKKPLVITQTFIILSISIITIIKAQEINTMFTIILGSIAVLTLINGLLASVVYYRTGQFLND